MKTINMMRTSFESHSVNEAYGRTAVVSFIACLDPTVEEAADIKMAVSEAVTNAIVHGYREGLGRVYITVKLREDDRVVIQIRDKGCGIADIQQAREPLYTTCTTGERAGLGFAMMESCMDKVRVYSALGKGTTVVMEKKLYSKKPLPTGEQGS